MQITIYHNPRCSKSQAVLSLLKERRVQVTIIEYMKSPPDRATLRWMLAKLGGPATQLLRTNEKEYQKLNLVQADDEKIFAAITANPVLLQRPIIVSKSDVVIGRPPEKALTLL